jgi:hypothetical protein
LALALLKEGLRHEDLVLGRDTINTDSRSV